MRWLVERLFRDEFLELEDGIAVYYPNSITGPGHILRGGDRNKLLTCYTLAGWAIPAYFVLPENTLDDAVARFLGDSFVVELFGELLFFAPFLLVFLIFMRRADRFLASLDRRVPASWDEDIARLQAAAEARERKPRIFLPLLAVIFVASLLGFALDFLLLALPSYLA